jgi:uroporphyrinogen decarboxylase
VNDRQRVKAILNYQNYDRMPVVHFGFWLQTLEKWAHQGYITMEQAYNWNDFAPAEKEIADKLGFDFNWHSCYCPNTFIDPFFEKQVLAVHSDGSKEVIHHEGYVVLEKDGLCSIPAKIDHLLKDRKSWEEHYLPRLQFSCQRITKSLVSNGKEFLDFNKGGLDYLKDDCREHPLGLCCGSLFGKMRNILGVAGVSYLYVDDELLYDEIVETIADLCYKCVEYILKLDAKFDFGHFWEDICFKNGPLISPNIFERKIGLYYKKITNLLENYGIQIISVDSDGLLDALLPTWIDNGVNTIFPIEVGTWDASIEPWRKKYGRQLRGVGGMRKDVFAYDYKAVDNEIERLKPLVELGGYIPCPDHRIAPGAKWENVQYYCQRMRDEFGW